MHERKEGIKVRISKSDKLESHKISPKLKTLLEKIYRLYVSNMFFEDFLTLLIKKGAKEFTLNSYKEYVSKRIRLEKYY